MTVSPAQPLPWRLRACLLVVLSCVALRLLSSHDPYPGWSGDPFEMPNPIVGVTPLISLMLDVATLAAAWPLIRRSSSIGPWHASCLVLGLIPILLHAAPGGPNTGWGIDNALLGFNWFASLIGAVAAAAACRHRSDRSLVIASLLGLCPLLGFKGLQQYFIEHAATLAAFKADQTRFIEAQGWAVGSPMALAYERRVSQPEATGWFGLANVYASLAAAFFVASLGLAVAAIRARAAAWTTSLLTVATLFGAGMVLIAGAKGGFASALLGVLVLAAGHVLGRGSISQAARERLAVLFATGAVGGVLMLVAIRGLIGERLGELSILFRWFYLEGAAVIFREHWLLGTGPAAFREAYMLAKPALSPEDVSSPHSLLFDFACTLGIGGVLLGVVWFGLVLNAARSVTAADNGDHGSGSLDLRTELRWAALPLIIGVLGGAWIEQPLATPESTLLRLVGLVTGIVTMAGILVVVNRSHRDAVLAVAAAAMALAAHAQFEMTGITPGSAGWIVCLIAAAGPTCAAPRFVGLSRSGISLSILAAIAFLAYPVGVRAAAWESSLRVSYRQASTVGELKLRVATLSRDARNTDDSIRQVIADVSRELGEPVTTSPAALEGALAELHRRTLLNVCTAFEHAAAAGFDHFPTQRTMSKLCLAAAAIPDGHASERRQRAWSIAESIAKRSGLASAWSWAATVRLALPPETAIPTDAVSTRECLTRAAALSPHEPSHPQRLATLLCRSDPEAAASWAAAALDADEHLRLDPLRRFTTQERMELESIKRAGTPMR